MAYVQAQSSPRRAVVLGGVAVLHGAALLALITGFSVSVIPRIDDILAARQIPAEPPPQPQPSVDPARDPVETKFVAPKPIIDLTTSRSEATVIELVPVQPLPKPTASIPTPFTPAPSPTASFTPKAAMPLGSPGKWATSSDYPARALREEREGTTRFRVTIGTDGRVRNCEVTASSGSPELDRATCENVARRARFKPATDDTGAAVAGSYSNAIRWEIPD